MKQLTDISLAKDALLAGGLIVAKTDTIYGILARAVDPDAVSKLYLAKNRNPQKSCIILVSDIDHIPGLSASHKDYYLDLLKERPTTIVINPFHYYAIAQRFLSGLTQRTTDNHSTACHR